MGSFYGSKSSGRTRSNMVNSDRSNEAIWNDRRILIKSAHYGVPQIGATPATIDRIEAIIAALQDSDNDFTLYEVAPSWFKSKMSPSRSPRASHVMMVGCADVHNAGKVLKRMAKPQWNEKR